MLTSRQCIGVIVAVLAAAFLGIWLSWRPSEPSFDGRTLTQWIGVLGSSDSDEEAHAFAAIEAFGTNGLPIIIKLLGKRDSPEWRQKAKLALILSGAESQHASIPAMVRLSRDSDPGVRLNAVEFLAGVVWSEPEVLPALEARQGDADSQVRAAAEQAVGRHRAVKKIVEEHAAREF